MEYLAILCFILFLFSFSIGFYFLPGMVAFHREHPRAWRIMGLNVLAGWTIVGWCLALYFALAPLPRAAAPSGDAKE